MACVAQYDLLGVFGAQGPSPVCPVPTRFEQFGAKLGASTVILLAVLTGVALLVCIVAALIWPPRCKPGDRVVIGETLLLGR
jgi:hypothetical protein